MPQLEIIQTIGPAGEATPLLPTGHNRLLQGDCLALMGALPAESFDLLYLDPPFFSGQDYHLHDGAAHPSPSFRDTWEGGVHAYLDWLGQRLTAMHRLLRPTGALLVHLDWHAVHYVKVWLDHLFGYNHFQNEFIWYYSGGGASKKRFARKHDTILYYTKSAKEWTFHADAVRTAYKWTDGQKRADGSARNYQRGKLPDDVWEHHTLLPWGFESLGYPTQKPEALLERLIAATTNAGEVVGDFFCGSGTTAAVAQRLGRRWVTADESRVAICLAAERLAQLLAPTPPPRHAQRARAQAHARFAAIHDDPTRFGLEASTLTTCNLTLIPPPGMTVERLGGVDLSAGGP